MMKELPEQYIEIIRFDPELINWDKLPVTYKLSEDFIREFETKMKWFHISTYQNLSENFILEFKDKVLWHFISLKQNLSEDFIRENMKYLNIELLMKNGNILPEFKTKLKLMHKACE